MINKTLWSVVIVFGFQAFFVGAAFSKESEFCQSIYKDKAPKAILLDRDGRKVNSIELGAIDIKNVTIQPLRSWADRIASKCAAQHFQHAVPLFA
jgi:hypothetical protein